MLNKKARRLSACGLPVWDVRILRLYTRIGFYYDLRRIVFAVDRQLQIVGSRIDRGTEVEEAAEAAASATTTTATTATAATAESWRKVCGPRWSISAQVPLDAIDADFFRAREVANHFARIVRDRDLNIS